MIGRNKNRATTVFTIIFRSKYFVIVFVINIVPKPIKEVCNITIEFKVVNIDCIVAIIKKYSGGSFKLPFK
jgi:hypothetical protein